MFRVIAPFADNKVGIDVGSEIVGAGACAAEESVHKHAFVVACRFDNAFALSVVPITGYKTVDIHR